MAKWLGSRYLWGGLIILAGVVLLVSNITDFEFGNIFWSVSFLIFGGIFVSIFISNRQNWWAIVPGFALLSIGIVIGLNIFAEEIAEVISGSIVLLGIGIGFLLVYLANKNSWWPIIPAGVLISISVSVGLETYIPEMAFVGLFFLGIGITFGILALLPSPQGNMRWAWIPAVILAVFGFFFLLFSSDIFIIVGSAGLICLGILVIFRTLKRA